MEIIKAIKTFTLALLIFLFSINSTYAVNIVRFGPEYIPQYSAGRPLAFADIYVGNQDTDPTVAGNQKQLYIQEEDGTFTAVSQPISTGAGGVPLYNGDPVTLYVSGSYSITVLSSGGSQIYYNPNVIPQYEPGITTIPLLSDYLDLADAKTTIGNTPTELWVDDSVLMDENVTDIPITLKLRFMEGKTITTTGYTLGFAGSPEDHIIALPEQQIFEGTGTLSFGVGGRVYAAWAGAKGDFSTNCSVAVAAFETALPEGEIVLPQGRCLFEDEVTIDTAGIYIIGGAGGGKRHSVQAGGTKVIPGTSMLSTEYIFKFSTGINRGGLIDIYFIDESSDGSTIRNTEIAGCVYADGAQMSFKHLSFDYIKGSAIKTGGTFVKSVFDDIEIRGCGYTSKPAFWVTDDTQSCNFNDLRIEDCGGDSYLLIDTSGSSTSGINKFSQIGFEAQYSTIGNFGVEDTAEIFLELSNTSRNFFENIHCNQNDGTSNNMPKLLIDSTSYRNLFNNLNFGGERRDHNIEVQGLGNILTNLNMLETAAITGTVSSILVSGNYNQLTNIVTYGGSDYETIEIGGLDNIIGDIHCIGCDGQELIVSGQYNNIYNLASESNDVAADNVVEVSANRNKLAGIRIEAALTTTNLVLLSGDRIKFTDGIFYNNTSSTAISITGNRCKVSDSYFENNSDTIDDSGNNNDISSTYNDDVVSGVDEEITTDAQTLKHWGVTQLDTTVGAIGGTLGSGGKTGQIKTVRMGVNNGNYTLTVTNHETSDPEVFTFNNVTDTLVLMWEGSHWITIVNSGVAT